MSKLKCYIHPKIKLFYLLYLSMSKKADLISPFRCDKVGLIFVYVIILPTNPKDEESIRL